MVTVIKSKTKPNCFAEQEQGEEAKAEDEIIGLWGKPEIHRSKCTEAQNVTFQIPTPTISEY
jgi:hypothetical protein